ncbi:uncharacterized protein si:ch73-109d9.3 isoform X1 [Channa argus]|uniref:uncharacterized protein si:ch73-109d9.3 isoform X1 n=1 Tax=Channa argus TaxID=215402 RepID=UPI0029467C2B|nr:hypothetical protein Q8A73_003781 [Channa argus]
MSDLDTLIVTFQTQLSDVMETVVKTAMYEVTRLVEDGFLEEVKRRNQQVESLKLQLKWAENHISNRDGKESKGGRCVDCRRDGVELSADTADESQQDDILKGGGVKTEADPVERWPRSCRREVISASPQAAGSLTETHIPERTAQKPEEDNKLPAAEVKEEVMKKLSCTSVHLGGWSSAHDGETGSGPHSTSGMAEAHPKQTQENDDDILRNVIKQDRQESAVYVFSEELEETHMTTDQSHQSINLAGLLKKPTLASDKDCDPAKTRSSLKRTEHKLPDSVIADGQVPPGRDQNVTSGSPNARLQNSSLLGVTIKQEVIVDSDGCNVTEHIERQTKKSGVTPVSCLVKQHRVSSDAHKQNHVFPKMQEVMKLHSKVGTGLRLQAALQHLHRPQRRTPHTLSNSATALSAAHVVNINRVPTTSKSAQSPSVSVQRVQLGEKQAAALSRTSAQWVSIKTQHQSTNQSPNPDSNLHTGPRHILRCGQCGKCFPHPSNLKAHLQTHTGERPFCCSLCGRSFTKLSNLKAHRRVHTGERPYCCVACGKRFTQKCNLKRHQRIHLDV